jgi:hypothetical protein
MLKKIRTHIVPGKHDYEGRQRFLLGSRTGHL